MWLAGGVHGVRAPSSEEVGHAGLKERPSAGKRCGLSLGLLLLCCQVLAARSLPQLLLSAGVG